MLDKNYLYIGNNCVDFNTVSTFTQVHPLAHSNLYSNITLWTIASQSFTYESQTFLIVELSLK